MTLERLSQAREIYHQEYLVEDRPHPGYPDTLHAVDRKPVYQKHGAGYVKHAGGVGDTQEIPWQAVAAEEIGLDVFRCPF
ncbi:MAG: hypothetical protein MZV63_48865 [Marinilabiliales bacterium]|nr:hypothetical protein [Marinilabiliales bacterium]